MYKAAYLEGWGTGITRMIDACKAHNLPEPHTKFGQMEQLS